MHNRCVIGEEDMWPTNSLSGGIVHNQHKVPIYTRLVLNKPTCSSKNGKSDALNKFAHVSRI